ncbi:plasmid partitioning protein RepB [Planktotalea frisia]|nr:plasmid partitioning protein RepB [Planktotalea frisia]
MTDKKKKRLSMLDNLTVGTAPTPSSMIKTSRPMRAARDAVDGHKVWELDPAQIIDTRVADRLSHEDVSDLRASIEATGQTVPILLRRHSSEDDTYLLVYGRRRLEAIRTSDKVHKVRALIASMDDSSAIEAQISENMARRDLSYIEKALFAHELIESGFGNQTRVSEVLTVTKSAVSMGLAIVDAIGVELIQAIGPAQNVGRPRWDAMAKSLETSLLAHDDLVKLAHRTREMAQIDVFSAASSEDIRDPSVAAFDAVQARLLPSKKAKATKPKGASRTFQFDNKSSGKISRTPKGILLEVTGQGGFADFVEANAPETLQELFTRWKQSEASE